MSESGRLLAIGLVVLSLASALGVAATIVGAGSWMACLTVWPLLIAITNPLFPKPARRARE